MVENFKHILRFILFAFAQIFIFNQLELVYGIQLMIYPLFIFLLPLELNVFLLMLISFAFGGIIDWFSNTYGLHASAALILAYFRPFLLNFFKPRDGYTPGVEFSTYSMGYTWYFTVLSIFCFVQIFWFLFLEQFKWGSLWFLFGKTFLSGIISIALCFLVQLTFFKKPSTR